MSQQHPPPLHQQPPVGEVSFADIESAAARLDGVANHTPVFTARSIDAQLKAKLFFKAECLQRAGAFKFRGAYNTLASLPEQERQRGVLGFSSGNHAQALALAGKLLGIPVTVVMPQDAPAVKRDATQGYGAEIVLYERGKVVREELAATLSVERGLTVVPPYDHPRIIAGQGTAALELLRAVPELDALLVPCGGGGLLSGCALTVKTLQSRIRVIGVEPASADDATRSFYTGELHRVHEPETIADGARTPCLGQHTFPLVRRYVDEMVTVDDAILVQAMRYLWERLKLVVEPTGALAFAAAYAQAVPVEGLRVGILISGGNVECDRLPWQAGRGENSSN